MKRLKSTPGNIFRIRDHNERESLADLTDYHLYGVCNTCSRMERLKMLVLCGRLGPEQPIATVSRHLECTECGGRDYGIRIMWAAASELRYG